MNPRRLMHEDDVELVFEATQESRHTSMVRANDIARALVDRARSKAVLQQPDEDGVVPGPARLRIVVGFDRAEKSAKQRRFLHGPVLRQISEQVVMPDGIRYLPEVWKSYFRKLFVQDRWESYRMPGARRATPHRVRVSTEDLSVKQYSQLIDNVIDHAVAEFGVTFDFVAEERASVRHKQEKAQPREKTNADTYT